MAHEAPIGIFEPQVQADSAMPRRTIPSMSPTSEGLGFEALGNALDKKLSSDAATAAATQLADARVAVTKMAQENQQKYPTGTGYTDAMTAGTAKLSNDLLKGANGNPYLLAHLQPGITNINENVQNHSIQWEAAASAAYKLNAVESNTQKTSLAVEAGTTNYKDAIGEQGGAVMALAIPPAQKLEKYRQVEQTLALADVKRVLKDDPQAIIDGLKDPSKAPESLAVLQPAQREAALGMARTSLAQMEGNAVAQAYASGGERAGNAAYNTIPSMTDDPELRNMIQTQADQSIAAWRGQQRAKYDAPVLALETRLATGNVNPDDAQKFLNLHEAGVYTARETANGIGKVTDLLEQQNDARASVTAFQEAFDTGQRLDPESKKPVKDAADAYFQGLVKANNLEPGSAGWQNAAAEIFDRTNILPPSATVWARTALTGDDPKAGAAAAQTLERLSGIAAERGIPYELDQKTKAQSAMVVRAIGAGVPAEQAFNLYKNLAEMPATEKSLLDQSYKHNAVEQSNQQPLVQAANKKFNTGTIVSNVPDIPEAVKADYNTLLHDYYLETKGDAAAAADLASKDILQSGWGVTSVNGQREWMKWAPEAMGHDPAAVRLDLEKSVTGLTDDPSSARLVPYRDTDITHGMKWNVQVVGKDGIPQTVLGTNGMPLPFYLQNSDQEYQAREEKAKQDGMAKLDSTIKRNNAYVESLMAVGEAGGL